MDHEAFLLALFFWDWGFMSPDVSVLGSGFGFAFFALMFVAWRSRQKTSSVGQNPV